MQHIGNVVAQIKALSSVVSCAEIEMLEDSTIKVTEGNVASFISPRGDIVQCEKDWMNRSI